MVNYRSGLTAAIALAVLAGGLISPDPSTAANVKTSRIVAPAGGIIEGVLRKRTLFQALTAYRIPASEVLALSRSFKPLFDFRSAKPEDRYRISVDAHNHIQRFVYQTSPLEEYEAVKDGKGGYRVIKREIELDRRKTAKVFTIDTSLYQAVSDNGETHTLAGLIADIFAWDIDFFLYPRKGDRIAVIFERCYKGDRFLQYGNILAACYEGQRKSYRAFLFSDGNTKSYYDENGQPLKKMFLRTPMRFGRRTSNFSIRRFHPVSRRYKAHTGIDYGAPKGSPIMATASGQVAFAGWKGGYGKLMILKHPNGYETYYGHCSRLLKKRGQRVRQGEVVAKVGRTGVATGTHVHYEVRVNGTPINPNRMKKIEGKPLSRQRLAQFQPLMKKRLAQVEKLLDGKTELVLLGR